MVGKWFGKRGLQVHVRPVYMLHDIYSIFLYFSF